MELISEVEVLVASAVEVSIIMEDVVVSSIFAEEVVLSIIEDEEDDSLLFMQLSPLQPLLLEPLEEDMQLLSLQL